MILFFEVKTELAGTVGNAVDLRISAPSKA